ncbi:hypothetical protein [Spirosoma pollinicola]|uniref:Uncharacterized protein n=1 Tax=Spirosoma pollinicola TaxID=2057025 RepID=A0A2K8YWY6_9BACT|nr:hypothetical protein [Spirosoma pollinicola]AUD02109.1 hypothetical protein CWM47_09930 [Spirosoma pollinicola]
MAIRRKPISTDTIIAIAATFTSICALIVTLYQTKLTREQQLNSVWPYLIANEIVDENGLSSITIANSGIGPAIIDSVQVFYKGRLYRSPTAVVQALSEEQQRGRDGMSWYQTALEKGFVISQGQSLNWITVNGQTDNALFRKALPNIRAIIFYHSIYDEHWHSTFNGKGDVVVKD